MRMQPYAFTYKCNQNLFKFYKSSDKNLIFLSLAQYWGSDKNTQQNII